VFNSLLITKKQIFYRYLKWAGVG